MLSCVIFLCSWCSRNCGGSKSLRVITSYRNPLKFKLFGLPSYCTSISFCFIRRISTHWLIQIFLYQWLFSVFCSYLLLPRTKTFHQRVSILGDMWNSTEHDTQQADETLKLDCCEQESKQAEIPSCPNHSRSVVFSISLQFLLIPSFFPSRRSHQQIQILLAYPIGIVFLIFPSLLFFLPNFCSSYFSLKQLKSLNKPSECLIPTSFSLHSGKREGMPSMRCFLTTFRKMQGLTDYFYSGVFYSRNHTGLYSFCHFHWSVW